MTFKASEESAGQLSLLSACIAKPSKDTHAKNATPVIQHQEHPVASAPCLDVLIMLPGLEAQTYTYLPPQDHPADSPLAAGTLVSVTFGKQPNPVAGIVVAQADVPHATVKLKPIVSILDSEPLFDQHYLDLLHWMAAYTATSLSQVMACALPAVLLQAATRRLFWLSDGAENIAIPHDLADLSRWLKATPKGLTAKAIALKLECPLNAVSRRLKPLIQSGLADWGLASPPKPKRMIPHLVGLCTPASEAVLSKKQRALLTHLDDLLEKHPDGLPLKTIEKQLKTTTASLQKLADIDCVRIEHRHDKDVKSDFWPDPSPESLQASYGNLLPEQRDAVTAINCLALQQSALIHGVTGSGKTEIYLQLAAETMARGRQVLLIVPEIVLASHLSHRFEKRFGKHALCIWHSQVASGEKLKTWRSVQSGDMPLIIGARSAIFAPFKHLGLIIIDESHEDSLKQDAPAPRYDARSAVRFLARHHGARLVFGSATPDVAMTYQHTIGDAGFFENNLENNAAKIHPPTTTDSALISLTKRWSPHGLPPVDIVAHRGGAPHGVLSGALKTALQETLSAGHQAILLMNRRGFHTTLKCQSCQEIVGCPHCDVPMTVHGNTKLSGQSEGFNSVGSHHTCLKCHHCGYQQERPSFCPQCASPQLVAIGSGTQRIETVLAETFAGIRLGRLDGDTVRHKKQFADLMHQFETRQLDCLVGTQMVAKGLDNPNVTLVGVIQADAGFVIPDFKSSERTFQMLTQVAGRAGRGQWPGRVIFQVFDPTHPVLAMAQAHDYAAFYKLELDTRRRLKLPPFCQLIRFGLSSESIDEASGFGEGLARQLKDHILKSPLQEHLDVLGPAPCLIPRVNNRYRMHVLIKNTAAEAGHRVVTTFYRGIRPPKTVRLSIDVDCLSLI